MSDADETLDGLTPDFKLRMLRRTMDTGVVSPAMFGSAGNRALRPPSQRVAEEIEAWWARYRKPVPPDILRGLVGEAGTGPAARSQSPGDASPIWRKNAVSAFRPAVVPKRTVLTASLLPPNVTA